jgi:PleD family two-component response regulator
MMQKDYPGCVGYGFSLTLTHCFHGHGETDGKKNSTADTVKTAIIADDHSIMREGLRLLLEKSGRFKCIAEADDGYQAVKLAKELHPDIVIMDIRCPT